MRIRTSRAGAVLAALTLAIGAAACSPTTPDAGPADSPEATDVVEDSQPDVEPDAEPDAGDDGESGSYAFDANRDQMAQAIESAFASQGGKARWEGDTFILSVDGDADEEMAGFTQCRVLLSLLNEDDARVIEFPNGQVDCEVVLADT